jgi:hypothetical protein
VGGLSFPPQERAEELYRHGVKAEEDGDLAQAVKHWAALEQVEADTPRETRIRHEFGMARRKVVTDALALEDELTKLGPRDKPRSEQERLALLALRYERFKDTPLAHEHWLEVRRTASHRGWSLLASKRVREVQPLPPDPGGRRLELVQQSFKSAQESVEKDPAQAQALCEEIRALYTQDANPAVREVAKKAEALLAQLRPK